MSLSNAVKIHILDPIVFNAQRAEFKIPNSYWASSLKLVDVGVYSAQVDGKQTGLYYSSVNGVLSSIKGLTLLSGSTILDQIQELAAYGSVKNLMTTNQGSEDVSRFQLLNGISLTPAMGGRGMTTTATHKDYAQVYDLALDAGTMLAKQRHNNQIQISDVAENGPSGMLLLSDYMQMLKTIPVLPMLPDLRLVIEFNTNTADFYKDSSPATPASFTLTPIRPQLLAEELLGQVAPKGMLKVPFQCTIVERFNVPSAADGVTVSSSFRSGALRQRYVSEMILYNRVSSADDWMLRNNRSVAQKNEKIQIVLNGRKHLPDQGIDQEAQKLQYFNQTVGALNVPLAGALSSCADVVAGRDNIFADAKSRKLAHNCSFTAVGINDVIDRLDIEYQRTGSTLAPGASGTDQTGAFDLLMFAHVNRLLEVENGKIRLSY